MIKVSVIMPSLNVADYIDESLDSVMRQTLKDIEIICVDAGSTDGTLEKIESAASGDNRITVIKSPVKSYGFQVNLGLDTAKGEYIAILETDDYVSYDMYDNLYEVAEHEKYDFVKCDYSTYITENGSRRFIDRRISTDKSLYEKPFRPAENPHVVVDDWYLWNGIYRADFIHDNNIRFSETPGAAFQDVGFLHKVAVKSECGIFLGESLYRYCVDREGASSNSDRILRFIRQEYGLLTDDISGDTLEEKRLLYIRMARSFVRACMDSDDEILSAADDICTWFRDRLMEAERYGYLSESDLPVSLKGGYRYLIDHEEGYIGYRKLKTNELADFLGDGKSIVIFGCGDYGREAAGRLADKGYKIAGFMDNNKQLWGMQIDGMEVMSPEQVKELSKDTRYLIANEKYAVSIREQLEAFNEDVKLLDYTPGI